MDRFGRSLLDLRRRWRDPRAAAPSSADPVEPAGSAGVAGPAASASAGAAGSAGQAGAAGQGSAAGSAGQAGAALGTESWAGQTSAASSSGGPAASSALAGTAGGSGDLPGSAAAAIGELEQVEEEEEVKVDDDRSAPVYRGEMIELVYSRRQSRQSPPWAEVSDRDLLFALREGDEAALNELISRKTKPLLQLVTRILGDLEEARDVVQVTFFKVWENRAKFDERWSPNTWIYRIASNLAIDHLRSRRSRERSQEPVRQHLRQVADGRAHRDLSRLQQGEVAAIFRELAGALSEKQRMVFLMREVEGLSSPEVAGILGCRESTVRNHLFNARKYLRGELLRRYPEYAANFASAAAPPAAAGYQASASAPAPSTSAAPAIHPGRERP
jgi:RNA polymerase sigma-70 factor (ECF subfamily)